MIENSQTSADNAKLPKNELASDLNDSKSNFQVPKYFEEDRFGDQALNIAKMYANTELQSEPQVTFKIMPDLSDVEILTIKETNSNKQQKDWW